MEITHRIQPLNTAPSNSHRGYVQNTTVPYEVLVDSGADTCIFDAQIADILRINLSKGEEQKVAGITGVAESYYIHPVVITIGGWEYKVKVGFLPNIGKFGYGVVGQKGFFDNAKKIPRCLI